MRSALRTIILAVPSLFQRVMNLFRNGEQGVFFDCSDLTTMFTDSAGTTPVVTPGTTADQPVGLILDKSRGRVLGAEIGSNSGGPFIATTGFVGNAPGVTTVSVVSGNLRTSIDTSYGRSTYAVSGLVVGKTYKIVVVALASAGDWYIDLTGGFASGSAQGRTARTITLFKTATATTANILLIGIDVSPFDISNISVRELAGAHATQSTAASRPLLSARINELLATTTLSTQNVTTKATPYTLQHTGTGTITLSGTSTSGPLVGAGTLTFTPTAGTLTLTVTGSVTLAQLETGSTASRYQRVTSASDYDSVGFSYFLKFDSIDDSLSTSSIDFTSTDKMTVVAGVRLLTDALDRQTVVELGPDSLATQGTFGFQSSPAFTPKLRGQVFGTTAAVVDSVASYAAPRTLVTSLLFDIAGAIATDEIKLRANGVVSTGGTVLSPAGVGNFGNYPLYIGRRGGTSLPFSGHIYSLIIRGAASTDAQIASAEAFVNSKTKAY